jgi:hypothetical protein
MNMDIDLTKLSTPQLRAIRKVLTSGALAESSRSDKAEVKKLKLQIEQLRLLNSRWQQIENAGVADSFDYSSDADYILGFTDQHFEKLINDIADAKKATAEKIIGMRVPPIIGSSEDIDVVAALREELRKRRNGGGR